MSSGFGEGLRMIMDAAQDFACGGEIVYLRVKKFTAAEAGVSQEVGVPITPTDPADAAPVGYQDIEIVPQPGVTDVSMRDIGLLNGKLMFGAKVFLISHTFVLNQLTALAITQPEEVFRNRDGHQVIGVLYQNRIFSIESLTNVVVSGIIMKWKLVGNALEVTSEAPVQS